MREIINNVVYDTEESRKIAGISYSSTYYSYVDLYQTSDGAFFEHCQSHHPEDDYALHEKIVQMSVEDAQDFIVSTFDREVCMCSGGVVDEFIDGLLKKFLRNQVEQMFDYL